MSEEKKRPGVIRRVLSFLVGVGLLALVGYEYATSLAGGAWPIGHPWLGVGVGSFGAHLAFGSIEHRIARLVKWAALLPVIGSAAMGLWGRFGG